MSDEEKQAIREFIEEMLACESLEKKIELIAQIEQMIEA